MSADHNINTSRELARGYRHPLAVVTLFTMLVLPLAGCLTPETPQSASEERAASAAGNLLGETLIRAGGEAGEGGGDGH